MGRYGQAFKDKAEYRPDKRPVLRPRWLGVRVGRALSVGESREELGRLLRMARGERARSRS